MPKFLSFSKSRKVWVKTFTPGKRPPKGQYSFKGAGFDRQKFAKVGVDETQKLSIDKQFARKVWRQTKPIARDLVVATTGGLTSAGIIRAGRRSCAEKYALKSSDTRGEKMSKLRKFNRCRRRR